MMEITFLGTSCMQPTKNRNHSGFLLQYGTENILFDCGEGIQRQMRVAGLKPAKITRILISHWHGDHVFGLPGLLSSMGADQANQTVKIYGPKGSKKYLQHLFQGFAAKEITPFEVKEVGSEKFFENDDFVLEAQKLEHSVPCVGYRFQEKDKRRIIVSKAQKLGMEGPILGKIQQGEDVVFKGVRIKADDFTTIVLGRKMGYIADTRPCQGAQTLAKDADLLISEGTHLNDIREKTEKYMHLTVKDAALIASENNTKKLIITHISPRYKEPSEILAEAKMYFENSSVAEDFMKVNV